MQRTEFRPKIGIICGSGLGSLADQLTETDIIDYKDIPHFPVSTVEGHVGRLVFGYLGDTSVVAMQGRFHYYEGYDLAKCSMPVRVMKLIGCTNLIATNAAGGLNDKFKVGDIMIMRDHINIMGLSGIGPLIGPNDARFGPRFPPMANAYDSQYIKAAKEIAKNMNIEDDVKEGVYTCVGGPNYETVAEMRMLKMIGLDAVGMSTVHEAITARHCDMKVFAFSLITNICSLEYDDNEGENANHEEVITVAKDRQSVCAKFVTNMVKAISESIK